MDDEVGDLKAQMLKQGLVSKSKNNKQAQTLTDARGLDGPLDSPEDGRSVSYWLRTRFKISLRL